VPGVMKKRKNIVITGFMGTGKTTVGREVAGRLGMKFYDTDEMVEARCEMSVAEIFERFGEDRFREIERAVFSELVEAVEDAVISTGGGTLLCRGIDDRMLDSSMVCCLTASVEVLKRRIGESRSRPLAGAATGNIESLLRQRERKYAVLPNQIDTSELTPEQGATEIIRIYQSAV